MQYVQYERKESIFELLTDLNLITLILKSLSFKKKKKKKEWIVL